LNFLNSFSKNTQIRINFQENPSSGSQIIPCRRTDRKTDMKLILAFRNFENAPKNIHSDEQEEEIKTFIGLHTVKTDPSGRADEGVCLWPLTYWDCGFESHRGRGCLF